MRDGWEIRKLGEITSFVGDGDWIESKDQSPEGIRLIQTGNIGEGTYKDKGERAKYISTDTFQRLHCTEIFAGDCLVSRLPDPIGRACILPKLNGRTITAVDCSIIRFKPTFLPQLFVYYSLSNRYQSYINTNATGTTRKRISRKRLEQVPVHVPTIVEQEKIVAELDCLTGIFGKKKQQLEELDKLAQSIFYDMFGDPITNEKGWPVKRLGEIGKVITGNTPTTRDAENYSSNDYCFVKPGDIGKDAVETIEKTEAHISTKAYMSSRRLPIGSVLTTCIGIVGKVGITGKEATCNQQINAILPNDGMSSIYVATAILLCRKVLEVMANAPVVPIINKGDFSSISIPFPPLDLQNEFAQKIEAIEKQKELVKRSIVETEMLFKSRMDYWFK